MNDKDVCILCGCETPYNRNTPISQRHGYIEGAGQTCYVSSIDDLRRGDFKCPQGVDKRNKKIHII